MTTKPKGRPSLQRQLDALTAHSRTTFDTLWPGGRWVGADYVVLSPIRDESKAGSFRISGETGLWIDHGTQDKGNLLQLIARTHADGTDKAARAFVARFVTDNRLLHTKPPAQQAAEPEPEPAPAEPMAPDMLPPEADQDGNPVVASWTYTDKDGGLLFWVCRSEPPGEGKRILPCYVDGDAYVWGMPTIVGGTPVYRVVDALAHRRVMWGEGEKVADHLSTLRSDAVGVTTQGGATAFKKAAFLQVMEAVDEVTVFPDADDAGQVYAAQVVVAALLAKVDEVRVLDIAALSWVDGQDAADFPALMWDDYLPLMKSGKDYLDSLPGRVRITAVVQVLKGMDPLDRLAHRKEAAKLCDVPVTALDARVKAREDDEPDTDEDAEEADAELTAEERAQIRDSLYPEVQHLANSPDIVPRAIDTLRRLFGIEGEQDNLAMLFLAAASRNTRKTRDRPLSVITKGESGSGKSVTASHVLKLYAEGDAWHQITVFSEKSLFYSDKEWKNRIIFVPEANQLDGDSAQVLLSIMRQLVSEGVIRLETTVKDEETGAWVGRTITKEGPTGLWVGTTRDTLDQELETRALTLHTDESQDQTRRIAMSLARRKAGEVGTATEEEVEAELQVWQKFDAWHSLQDSHDVVIPFAVDVVMAVRQAPVRFRRDWSTVWSLVRAHASLHRMNREIDDQGRVIATLEDYEKVARLIDPFLTATAGEKASDRQLRILAYVYGQMPAEVRSGTKSLTISSRTIGAAVGVPFKSVARAIKVLIDSDQLINREVVPTKAMRLQLGPAFTDPSLTSPGVLPTVDYLKQLLERKGQA